MISAVSGSNATALLALFGRNRADAPTNPASAPVEAAAAPPPLSAGSGTPAQSLFDALVHAGDGGSPGAAPPSLNEFLSSMLENLDTDGDGELNLSELKSAFANLTGATADDSPRSVLASPGAGKSLYESLFDAIAAEDGAPTGMTRKGDLAQKFRSVLGA